MKLLWFYKVTADVMPRFRRSIAFQEKHIGWFDGWDRMIATDRTTTGFPIDLPLIRCDVWDGPKFNQSKMWNQVFEYAIREGYDFLYGMDCDAVIVKPPPLLGQFSITAVYRTEHGGNPERMLEKVRNKEISPARISWFLLRRDVFEKARFHEEFRGYGWEDIDFKQNVLERGMGILPFRPAAEGIHIWHTRDLGFMDAGDMIRNKKLFISRGGRI